MTNDKERENNGIYWNKTNQSTNDMIMGDTARIISVARVHSLNKMIYYGIWGQLFERPKVSNYQLLVYVNAVLN